LDKFKIAINAPVNRRGDMSEIGVETWNRIKKPILWRSGPRGQICDPHRGETGYWPYGGACWLTAWSV